MITVPAMLPIFLKLKMDRRVLATIVALGAGTMNVVPWGGPTIRAATALEIPVMDLFSPMIIPQICGVAAGIGFSIWFGIREKRRLGSSLGEIEITIAELSDKEKRCVARNYSGSTSSSLSLLLQRWLQTSCHQLVAS